MGKSAVVARLLPITQLSLHSLISPPGADYNIDLHNPLRTLPPSLLTSCHYHCSYDPYLPIWTWSLRR